jgi:hypothetical protein
MNVNVYSVIWADDECATLEKDKSIRQLFDVKHIEVLAYVQTSEDLKDKLECYKDRVDAVIIDGNFSKSVVEYLEPEDISGLIHTVSFIELFNSKRDIPFFLYTARKVLLQKLCNNGEIDYFTDNRRLIQKGNMEQLANQIVHDVDHIHSVEFMVKKKYQSLLNIAQKVSPQCEAELHQFLLDEERDCKYDKAVFVFNSLRKVLEQIMEKCKNNNIIPDYIKTLNDFKFFLCDKRSPIKPQEKVLPPTIKSFLWSLIDILQDGSHQVTDLHLYVSEYVQDIQSPFIFRACLFQVMAVLRWYNDIISKLTNGDLTPPLYAKINNYNR